MEKEIKKTVSIVGCGWLGLPLAQQLLSAGYAVKGTTTTPAKLSTLAEKGITPYLAALDPAPTGPHWAEILDADYLIVDVPPRRSQQGGEFHPQQISHMAELVKNSSITAIIQISSTSVYRELGQSVVEDDVQQVAESGAPALMEAELIMASLRRPGRNVAVLRCGGLMGYDRIPGKYVRGKKDITTGALPVNYIHRDDVIGSIMALLAGTVPDETFNVVTPLHPTRREVYLSSCAQFGWEAPTFKEPTVDEPYKLVLSDKLVEAIGYTFKYADPLKFHYLPD